MPESRSLSSELAGFSRRLKVRPNRSARERLVDPGPDDSTPRIALDAMGSDLGLEEVVAGALLAVRSGASISIVGRSDEIRSEIERCGAVPDSVDIVHAAQVVGNDEEPAQGVRSKDDSSVVTAVRLVSEGRCAGMVGAGSTGAVLAASLFELRRIKGVKRPAIALLLPLPTGRTLLLDVGANSANRAEHLVQFAFLGSAFMEGVEGVDRPSVALLSIGEESKKGSPEVVEAHERLSSSSLNFIGNVEGRDIPRAPCDVVVTDGFTGNVALKLMEGSAKMLMRSVRDSAVSTRRGKLGGVLLRPSVERLRNEFDPNTTGGALLLGINGVVVIAHGSANRHGIANALGLAARSARARVVERTAERLQGDAGVRTDRVIDEVQPAMA